jgi:hypothetical protein
MNISGKQQTNNKLTEMGPSEEVVSSRSSLPRITVLYFLLQRKLQEHLTIIIEK